MPDIKKFIATKTVPSDGPFMVASVDFSDKALKDITFANLDGSIAFRLVNTGYQSVLQIPEPPVMVKRIKLSATNETLKVTLPDEFIEDTWDVNSRTNLLQNAGFTVTTCEVEIPEQA